MYRWRFTLASRDPARLMGLRRFSSIQPLASRKSPHQRLLAAFAATCQSDHAAEVIRPLDEGRNNCSLTTEQQRDEKRSASVAGPAFMRGKLRLDQPWSRAGWPTLTAPKRYRRQYNSQV